MLALAIAAALLMVGPALLCEAVRTNAPSAPPIPRWFALLTTLMVMAAFGAGGLMARGSFVPPMAYAITVAEHHAPHKDTQR